MRLPLAGDHSMTTEREIIDMLPTQPAVPGNSVTLWHFV
jgi:hypothetical protein